MEGRREGGSKKEITRGPYLDRDQLEDKHFLFEALRKVVGRNVLSALRLLKASHLAKSIRVGPENGKMYLWGKP